MDQVVYKNYTEENLQKAVNSGLFLRKATDELKIPMQSIKNKPNKRHLLNYGILKAFSDAEEHMLVQIIQTCGNWDQPIFSHVVH